MSQARREPKQARAQRTVSRILDAAQHILTEEGASSFNTNRLAEEAQVGVGTIYGYFPDKKSIAKALIERTTTEQAHRLIESWDATPVGEVRALVRMTAEFGYDLYHDNGSLYRDLWTVAEEHRAVGSRAGEELIVAAIVTRLTPFTDVLRIQDVTLKATMLFHLTESMCATLAPEGACPWSREVVVEEVTDAAMAYLNWGANS